MLLSRGGSKLKFVTYANKFAVSTSDFQILTQASIRANMRLAEGFILRGSSPIYDD